MAIDGRCSVLSSRIAWFLASLIVGSGGGAPVPAQRPPNLVGRITGDHYYHPSGVFTVRTSTGNDIEDSQASVTFNFGLFGARTGWSEVAFVKPQLTSGRTPDQVVEALVAEFGRTVYRNKDRQIRPAVVFSERRSALGRPSTYARIRFPQYPGTGMTTFSDGRVVDVDFIGHFELVPIEDLFLRQRQGRSAISWSAPCRGSSSPGARAKGWVATRPSSDEWSCWWVVTGSSFRVRAKGTTMSSGCSRMDRGSRRSRTTPLPTCGLRGRPMGLDSRS